MKFHTINFLSSFSKVIGLKFFQGFLITITFLIYLAPYALGDDESKTELTPPPGKLNYLSEQRIIKFPFDIYRGDIRFNCKINGHDVQFLLDDGFHWDQLLFWGSPKVDSLGLKYEGEISIGGSKDDSGIQSRTASGITVGFPGVELTDQEAIITPYSSGNSVMWSGSVGQISAGLLKHFIVDINFDEMMMTLSEPGKFEYGGSGVAVPWEPIGFGPWSIPVNLKLSDGRDVSVKVLMDLGYNDQLEIATGKENSITVPENSTAGSLGRNIEGTETLGYFGRMPQIEIGGYKINNAIVAYISEEHSKNTFSEVMIGLGLLSRFNLVFDYYDKRLFIEPNKNFSEPFE
ncbi:MAG: hypothetical protein V3V99_05170 [candidate division Zixibacteria bacterium]